MATVAQHQITGMDGVWSTCGRHTGCVVACNSIALCSTSIGLCSNSTEVVCSNSIVVDTQEAVLGGSVHCSGGIKQKLRLLTLGCAVTG